MDFEVIKNDQNESQQKLTSEIVYDGEDKLLMKQILELPELKGKIRCIYQLPLNSLLFSLAYAYRSCTESPLFRDFTSFIQSLAFGFELFTYDQATNEKNLNSFKDMNEAQKQSRFKKKFHKFQQLRFEYLNMGEFCLVTFNFLLEYLIDNVQPNILLTFLPKLFSAVFKSNLNIHLYYRNKYYKVEYRERLAIYTSDLEKPLLTKDQDTYFKNMDFEREHFMFRDQTSFDLFIYESKDKKTKSYFVLYPFGSNLKPLTDKHLEVLITDWRGYTKSDRESRYNLVKKHLYRFDDLLGDPSFNGAGPGYPGVSKFQRYCNSGRLRNIEPTMWSLQQIEENEKEIKDFNYLNFIQDIIDNRLAVSVDLNNLNDNDHDSLNDFLKNLFENFQISNYRLHIFIYQYFSLERSTLYSFSEGADDPPKNYIWDYCKRIIIEERKTANKTLIERLLDLNHPDLIDMFDNINNFNRYYNGFIYLKEQVLKNDEKLFNDIKNALSTLIALCGYPALYAVLNLFIIPDKNLSDKMSIITIPPLHIAPLEPLFTMNFVIYFDGNSYKVTWIADENWYSIGDNFHDLIKNTTAKSTDQVTYFSRNTYRCCQKMIDPIPFDFNFVDEFDLKYLLDINLRNLLEKEEKEEKLRLIEEEKKKSLKYRTIVKEEYIARVTMSYNTYSK